MKKFIVLSFVALLVLAFGTMAFAQEPKLDFRASGFITTFSTWGQNITTGNTGAGLYNTVSSTYRPGGAAYDDTVSWMATRGRLKFDAVMGKNLSGTIFFEMDSSRWGEVAGSGAQRNQMGHWSGDRAALEIKNAYIDFGVPGIPVPISVRAGLQPLALRSNMLIYTDGMGITGNIKVDPANIQLIWFKALENKDYASDDVDIYGLHANAKVGQVTVGGYGINYNMNTYPFADGDIGYQANFWWLGVYADGKLGPVNLNFDFIYDRGTVEDRFAPIYRDVKYRGWATRAKVDFPWEKFNFGVVGMYASGSDTKKTSSTGLPAATGTTKVGGYVTPPGSESFGGFTESIVFYGSAINNTGSGIGVTGNYTSVSGGSIGGTWMGKLYGSFKATPWYKVTLQGIYIGDTTKNGNTVGTARKADGMTLRDDKSIGWEVDLINEIQIYKNLKFNIGMGALFPGDGLRYWDSATSSNDKPKTPWAFLTELAYTF